MTPKYTTRAQVIADIPSDVDELGSHQRIAEAMCHLVCNQPGGKTIGLEGDWGSGKSTVLNLFTKLVHSDTTGLNVRVFSFDAWAHQNDPLRRIFFESLVDEAVGNKWLPDPGNGIDLQSYWANEKDRLSMRVQDTTKEAMPILPGVAQAFLLLLVLLPMGTALLAAGLREKASPYAVYFGLFFSAAPFVILVFALIRYRKDKAKLVQLITIFSQRTSTKESSRTTDSGDPTSLEFQEGFKKIASAILTSPDHKLVVVLDNLDRISEEEASACWAMLRSFIDNSQLAREAWFPRLWVIVPFARLETPNGQQSAAKQCSFLEKVLHIEFFVPRPVLSHWRLYLEQLLSMAFPRPEDTPFFYKIGILFAENLKYESAPSPRALISTVNEIVALDLQWHGDIPLDHQALYVLLRRSVNNLQAELIAGELPNDRHRAIVGEAVRNSLAALALNVPVDLAFQILLRPIIRDSLMDSTGGRLMEEYRRKGFPDAFDLERPTVIEEFSRNSPELFAGAVSAIQRSGFEQLTQHRPESWHAATAEIGRASSNLPAWPLNDPHASLDSILCFVRMDPFGRYRDSLFECVRRTAFEMQVSNLTDELEMTKLASISVLWADPELKDYFGGGMPAEQVRIKCTVQKWMELCLAAESPKSVLNIDMLDNGGVSRSVADTLGHNSKAAQFRLSDEAVAALRYSVKHGELRDSNGLAEAFGALLGNTGTPRETAMKIISFLVRNVVNWPQGQTLFARGARNGWWSIWLARGINDKLPTLSAESIYAWISGDPGLQITPNNGGTAHLMKFANNPRLLENLLNELAKLIIQNSDFVLLKAAGQTRGTATQKIAAAVWKEIKKTDPSAVFDALGEPVISVAELDALLGP